MKTPEEIKWGLECCFPCEEPDCFECPYRKVASCAGTRIDDTLAYIRQLEAERDAIEKDFAHVAKQLDLAFACEYCMHYFSGYGCKTCDFQWKGYQPGMQKED